MFRDLIALLKESIRTPSIVPDDGQEMLAF